MKNEKILLKKICKFSNGSCCMWIVEYGVRVIECDGTREDSENCPFWNFKDNINLVTKSDLAKFKSEEEEEEEETDETPCKCGATECGGSSTIGDVCYTCPAYDPERDGRLDRDEEYEEEEEEEENTPGKKKTFVEKVISNCKSDIQENYKDDEIFRQRAEEIILATIKHLHKNYRAKEVSAEEEEEEEGPLSLKTVNRITGEQLRELPIKGDL